ncbi:hypothetical protein A5662_10975 [Mycobacteriaceae bacterium 1482268.1]|nr:hypothetical protein A5662_10975 [Mycobacteriaceae bacterium 1482268.1]
MSEHLSRQVRSRPSDRGRATPYKLVVLGSDTGEIVRAAGGLVVDSIRAGWHVEVYLESAGDDRALHVLGVSGRAMPTTFDYDVAWPDAVFFAAGLPERNVGVGKLITDAIRRRRTDLAKWDDKPVSDHRSGTVIEHRLSSAALAFKQHAMTASGMPAHAAPVEAFHSALRRPGDIPPPLPRA